MYVSCVVCAFRQACQLLTDIVYFVASKENTGGDPFDVQLTHPDRERQKLLREQNVLKEVCRFSCRVKRLKLKVTGSSCPQPCKYTSIAKGQLHVFGLRVC